MLEVTDLHAYYGKSHILQGVEPARRRGRDRRLAGPQRRRPLDHLQGDHGRGPPLGSIRFKGRRSPARRPSRSPAWVSATCPRTATSFPG